MTTLDHKTKVGLIDLVVMIPALIAAVFWLSGLQGQVTETERINVRQDIQIDNQMKILLDIRDRLARIEERLKKSKE